MKKATTEADIRRIKRFNYTVLAVLGILLALLLLWFGIHRYWADFTPDKWAAHPGHRMSMTDDLLERHPITGMTVKEMTALLGPWDEETAAGTDDGKEYVYYLGDSWIDSVWLVLSCENGVVSSYDVRIA